MIDIVLIVLFIKCALCFLKTDDWLSDWCLPLFSSLFLFGLDGALWNTCFCDGYAVGLNVFSQSQKQEWSTTKTASQEQESKKNATF